MALKWKLGCMYPFEPWFSQVWEKIPGMELLDHMVAVFLVSWGTSILFCIVTVPFLPTVQESSLLSTPSPVFIWLVWGDIYIYIYFFLICLFLTVLGLCCCTGFLVAAGRVYFSCSARASLCSGFTCGTWVLGHLGFSSCSTWTQ